MEIENEKGLDEANKYAEHNINESMEEQLLVSEKPISLQNLISLLRVVQLLLYRAKQDKREIIKSANTNTVLVSIWKFLFAICNMKT